MTDAEIRQDEMAKKGIHYQVSAVSFEGVMPNANNRNRVLKDAERPRLLKECPLRPQTVVHRCVGNLSFAWRFVGFDLE